MNLFLLWRLRKAAEEKRKVAMILTSKMLEQFLASAKIDLR